MSLRGMPARNAAKTHCYRGHELFGPNLRIDEKGKRVCRECASIRAAAGRARRNARPNRRDAWLTLEEHATPEVLANYMPIPEAGCWLWLGSYARRGYGKVGSPIRGNALAHRVFYTHYKGTIPEGLLVMHKCDTPLCVNPDHLAVGTTSDNALDMHRKKRHPGRLKNRNALNPGGSRE